MTDFKPGQRIHGYRVARAADLSVIKARVIELEHEKSGAAHIHVKTDDRENCFGVVFKTVPEDSTGIAHILEHTVLCGSTRYPVRDPFFSMLKRSLSSFMNAFTASDWTMYPFATQNRQDYYNLMSVYIDSAFNPRLDPVSFMQEGHRLEVEPHENASDYRLAIKGVVYNEMKGAMSSPDQVMARSMLQALFPDTTYRFNSGGEPEEILNLTHENLVAFHRRYYHPSNSIFYTYGDLPMEDHLSFLDKNLLDSYTAIDPRTDVPSQPRWSEPKKTIFHYPFSKKEDPSSKYQACLAWLTADVRDSFNVLALTLLEQILLGNPGSPLRRALIESGLGSDLSDGTGFSADLKDTLFACGLKDIREDDVQKVQDIIIDLLSLLNRDGIDKKLIDAAIHQIEFAGREITNTPYPYGIQLLLKIAGPALHGADPVQILNFDQDLEKIKKLLKKGSFFEGLIDRYFLQNRHRVLMVLAPDQSLEEERTRREQERLESIRKELGKEDVKRIIAQNMRLAALQEKEEDLSCLPTLKVADIPPSIETVLPSNDFMEIPSTIYCRPTAQILYYTSAVAITDLAPRLCGLLPFFCFAMPRIGTEKRDYTSLSFEIDARTGGIGFVAQARSMMDESGAPACFVSVAGKALHRNSERMLDIIDEMVSDFSFNDLSRLKSLLMEYRARLESSIVANGHRFAISLASRTFSPASHLNEVWHGIHQLKLIRSILEEKDLENIAEELDLIGRTILVKNNFHSALVGESESLLSVEKMLKERPVQILNRRNIQKEGFLPPGLDLCEDVAREAWTTTTAVSFVAQVFPTVPMGHPDAPALAICGKILKSCFLHREIREKGGAYGGFALYNPEDGLFSMASYRDPHLLATIEAFEKGLEFILKGEFSDLDVDEAILQVCSDIDRPDPPGAAAKKAFFRSLVALSDEKRRDFKLGLLGMDKKRVVQAAEKHLAVPGDKKAVAVITSSDRINRKSYKERFVIFDI